MNAQEELSKIPYGRAYKIVARTIHLLATGTLLGGHVFGAPADPLRKLLYVAIVSGIAMIVLEAYPKVSFIFDGWALLMVAKLTLLVLVAVAWNRRVPLLVAVVALASVGSHMPGRWRHWSLIDSQQGRQR